MKNRNRIFIDYLYTKYSMITGVPTKASETIEWFYNGKQFKHIYKGE